MSGSGYSFEEVGGVQVCVSRRHKFGTDAFLLAHFAAPRRKETACDLGTGCGIIPLLWQRGESPPRHTWGVEVAPEAVEQLTLSLERNQLQQKITPLCADLRSLQGGPAPGSLDLISCNPPYFAQGTGYICPGEARRTARHEFGCSVADVCAAAARLLKYGGRLCLCQRPERLCDVLEAMRAAGIEPKRLRFVHQRPGSPPWLFLCEGRRGGRPSLQVLPPLIIESPGGGFSEELLAIYGKTAEKREEP